MGLHFYKNGTVGLRNGEELSGNTHITPLEFSGIYPAVGTPVTITKPVCIRADLGETWYLVHVSIQGAFCNKYSLLPTSSENSAYRGHHIIGIVGDTNIEVPVTVIATDTEAGTLDQSCQIKAWGYQRMG